MSIKLALIGAAACVALAGSAAHAAPTTLYSNNFDSGSPLAGLSGAEATSGNIFASGNPTYGSFLDLASQGGSDANGTATLTINTAGYSSLTLNYDVYALATVDGDGLAGGNTPLNPDAFITAVTGGKTLENYSFANYGGDTQNYPGGQGPPTPGELPQTGAAAINVLPIDGDNDAIYDFSYTFAPTGSSTAISFTGQTNQGLGDESFGLDNVSVTGVMSAVSAAPEPSTWLLMIAGIGGIGLMLRRAKQAMGVRFKDAFTA